MSPPAPVDDGATRERALDAGRSFLVQAPAGSGKTELLIQRLLRLLGIVDQPEEILAITFTRKAAAEMRERVVGALARARAGDVPGEAHLRVGYELARAAIARDEALGWGLADQPGRLRIGTIDSVNAWLNARAPLTAGQQALNRVSDRPESLYREAARQTLSLAADNDARGEAMRDFLRHCDNRAELAIAMLVNMLARRDQWLRHTGTGEVDDNARAGLEAAIASLVEGALQRADARLPHEVRAELSSLLAFAATNLATRGDESELLHWLDYPDFPPATASAVAAWRGLAQGLLTRTGEWRRPKGLNVRIGFPKEEPEFKARMGELLVRLGEDEALRASLDEVQQLPDSHYTDTQWQSLKAIVRVLPLAAAMLQQVFDARGETDFPQLAGDALRTLGSDHRVGELSLVLDYTLRHVLLDEYQDTSRSQFELLERLTAGWEADDGRTLFLVGDPMQSIYRFREAEVGIFLETRLAGVNARPLDFLRLTTNFRSAPAIVDWVNESFAQVMPRQEDSVTGAVPLSPSQAFRAGDDSAGVSWHVLAEDDREEESRAIVNIVRDSLARWPQGTVGILVRSRAHAVRIGPRLRAAGIGYVAPDLELLGQEPAIQDLLGLTRALTHLADRIAWLAILRAPWCGLTLQDLHGLAGGQADQPVWSLLQEGDALARMSEDGRARASLLREQIRPWLGRRGSCPLRDVVEGAWQCLGGPACLEDEGDLELAAEFFDYLDEVDTGGDCGEIGELLDGIIDRPVLRQYTHDTRVQVMTMHKAKGLEFDTVVLPALGARTRATSKPLLLWQELSNAQGLHSLVLAPLQARGDNKAPLFESLWRIEQQREAYELQRLLYVATTRARERLHLFASLPGDPESGPLQPDGRSLLRVLWPAVRESVENAPRIDAIDQTDGEGPQWFEVPLRRLPASWTSPLAAVVPAWGEADAVDLLEDAQAHSSWVRVAGTVAHRWLQELARQGAEGLEADHIEALQPRVSRQLRRLGLHGEDHRRACERVASALANTLADEKGRWILSGRHAQATSEWSLGVLNEAGEPEEKRLDRSFVDASGQRWIIDFKISAPSGENVEQFIQAQQQRYRDQLLAYSDALNQLETGAHPVRAALYFPLLPRFAEVTLPGKEASE